MKLIFPDVQRSNHLHGEEISSHLPAPSPNSLTPSNSSAHTIFKIMRIKTRLGATFCSFVKWVCVLWVDSHYSFSSTSLLSSISPPTHHPVPHHNQPTRNLTTSPSSISFARLSSMAPSFYRHFPSIPCVFIIWLSVFLSFKDHLHVSSV